MGILQEKERYLKRVLKNRVSINQGTVIAYLIAGFFGVQMAEIALNRNLLTEEAIAQYLSINPNTGQTGKDNRGNPTTPDQNMVLIAPDANNKGWESVIIGTKVNTNSTAQDRNNQLVVIGHEAVTDGSDIVAIGRKVNAKNTGAVAIGQGTKAGMTNTRYKVQSELTGNEVLGKATLTETASSATAVGYSAVADKGQSVAVGSKSYAGFQSTALGSDTYAVGNSSIAIGSDDIVSFYDDKVTQYDYDNYFKEIYKTKLIGDRTVNEGGAYGYDNATGNPHGQYPQNRKYSPTIATAEGAIAIGSRALAAGIGSTSLGTLSYALKTRATALGTYSRAEGVGSAAIGSYTNVFADNSVGVGNNIQILNEGGMGYGYKAYAGGGNSIAIGSNVYANTYMAYDKTITNRNPDGNNQNEKDSYKYTIHNVYPERDNDEQIGYYLEQNATSASTNEKVNKKFYSNYDTYNAALEALITSNATGTTDKLATLYPNLTEKNGVAGIVRGAKSSNLKEAATSKDDVAKNAIVIGSNSMAIGDNSIAFGRGSFSLAKNTFALGSYSYSDSENAMAIGMASRALAKNSVAMGVGTGVGFKGENTVAIGTGSVAYGRNGILLGTGSRVGQVYRSAAAFPNIQNLPGDADEGRYYDGTGNIVIGNESKVYGNQNITFGNLINVHTGGAVNSGTFEPTTKNNMALGREINIYKGVSNSVAIGSGSSIGTASIENNAITNSAVFGVNARVINASTTQALPDTEFSSTTGIPIFLANPYRPGANPRDLQDGKNAMAIGNNALATLSNSVALGVDSKTDYTADSLSKPGWVAPGAFQIMTDKNTGVISVGQSGKERRIVNLASGAEDTDAVNVAQLRSLSERVQLAVGSSFNVSGNGRYVSVEREFKNLVNDDGSAKNGIGDAGKISLLVDRREQFQNYIEAKSQLLYLKARDNLNNEEFDASQLADLQRRVTEYEQNPVIKSKIESNSNLFKVRIPDRPDANDVTGRTFARVMGQINTAKNQDNAYIRLNDGNGILTTEELKYITESNYESNQAKGKDSTTVGFQAKTDTASNYSIAIGHKSNIKNSIDTVVIGREAQTDEDGAASAIAIGSEAKVSKVGAIAIGGATATTNDADGARATGEYAISLGAGSIASGNQAIAIGKGAQATIAGGIALGDGAQTSQNKDRYGYSISTKGQLSGTNQPLAWKSTVAALSLGTVDNQGNATQSRQITGVAAGTNDTDAVNVAQLKDAVPVVRFGGDNITTFPTNNDDGTYKRDFKEPTQRNIAVKTDNFGAEGVNRYSGANIETLTNNNGVYIGFKEQPTFKKVSVDGTVRNDQLGNNDLTPKKYVDDKLSGQTITYKAESGSANTVALSTGLDFVSDDLVIVADGANSGKVKFSIDDSKIAKPDLSNLNDTGKNKITETVKVTKNPNDTTNILSYEKVENKVGNVVTGVEYKIGVTKDAVIGAIGNTNKEHVYHDPASATYLTVSNRENGDTNYAGKYKISLSADAISKLNKVTDVDNKANKTLNNLEQAGKDEISKLAVQAVKVQGTGAAVVTSNPENITNQTGVTYTVNVSKDKIKETVGDAFKEIVNVKDGSTDYLEVTNNSATAGENGLTYSVGFKNEFKTKLAKLDEVDDKAGKDLANIDETGKDKIKEVAAGAKLKYKANGENQSKETTLSTGLTFKGNGIEFTTEAGGVVNATVNQGLKYQGTTGGEQTTPLTTGLKFNSTDMDITSATGGNITFAIKDSQVTEAKLHSDLKNKINATYTFKTQDSTENSATERKTWSSANGDIIFKAGNALKVSGETGVITYDLSDANKEALQNITNKLSTITYEADKRTFANTSLNNLTKEGKNVIAETVKVTKDPDTADNILSYTMEETKADDNTTVIAREYKLGVTKADVIEAASGATLKYKGNEGDAPAEKTTTLKQGLKFTSSDMTITAGESGTINFALKDSQVTEGKLSNELATKINANQKEYVYSADDQNTGKEGNQKYVVVTEEDGAIDYRKKYKVELTSEIMSKLDNLDENANDKYATKDLDNLTENGQNTIKDKAIEAIDVQAPKKVGETNNQKDNLVTVENSTENHKKTFNVSLTADKVAESVDLAYKGNEGKTNDADTSESRTTKLNSGLHFTSDELTITAKENGELNFAIKARSIKKDDLNEALKKELEDKANRDASNVGLEALDDNKAETFKAKKAEEDRLAKEAGENALNDPQNANKNDDEKIALKKAAEENARKTYRDGLLAAEDPDGKAYANAANNAKTWRDALDVYSKGDVYTKDEITNVMKASKETVSVATKLTENADTENDTFSKKVLRVMKTDAVGDKAADYAIGINEVAFKTEAAKAVKVELDGATTVEGRESAYYTGENKVEGKVKNLATVESKTDATTGITTYYIGAKGTDIAAGTNLKYVGNYTATNTKIEANDLEANKKEVTLAKGLKFSSEELKIVAGEDGEIVLSLTNAAVDKADLSEELRNEIQTYAKKDATNIGLNLAEGSETEYVENYLAKEIDDKYKAKLADLNKANPTAEDKKTALEAAKQEVENVKDQLATTAKEKFKTEKEKLEKEQEANAKKWRDAIGITEGELTYTVNGETAEATAVDTDTNKKFKTTLSKGLNFEANSSVTKLDNGVVKTEPVIDGSRNLTVTNGKDGKIVYNLRETDYIDPANISDTGTYKTDTNTPNPLATAKAVVDYVSGVKLKYKGNERKTTDADNSVQKETLLSTGLHFISDDLTMTAKENGEVSFALKENSISETELDNSVTDKLAAEYKFKIQNNGDQNATDTETWTLANDDITFKAGTGLTVSGTTGVITYDLSEANKETLRTIEEKLTKVEFEEAKTTFAKRDASNVGYKTSEEEAVKAALATAENAKYEELIKALGVDEPTKEQKAEKLQEARNFVNAEAKKAEITAKAKEDFKAKTEKDAEAWRTAIGIHETLTFTGDNKKPGSEELVKGTVDLRNQTLNFDGVGGIEVKANGNTLTLDIGAKIAENKAVTEALTLGIQGNKAKSTETNATPEQNTTPLSKGIKFESTHMEITTESGAKNTAGENQTDNSKAGVITLKLKEDEVKKIAKDSINIVSAVPELLVAKENQTIDTNETIKTFTLTLKKDNLTKLMEGAAKEKGTVVYTNSTGERLILGQDGKIYDANELEGKVYIDNKKEGAEAVKGYFTYDENSELIEKKDDGTYALKENKTATDVAGIKANEYISKNDKDVRLSLVDAKTANADPLTANVVLDRVADGKLSEDSKEAVNGSQLYATNNRVKALEDVVGKPNVDNPQNPDSPADDDGLKPTDTLAKKVDALRRGEAGPVVYTIKENDKDVRVARAADGKYYKLSDLEGKVVVEKDGNKILVNYAENQNNIEDVDKDGIYTVKEAPTGSQATTLVEIPQEQKPQEITDKTKIRHSLVNEDGEVNTVSTLRNVAKGTVSKESNEAINGSQLYSVIEALGATVGEDGNTVKAPTYTLKVGNYSGPNKVDKFDENNPQFKYATVGEALTALDNARPVVVKDGETTNAKETESAYGTGTDGKIVNLATVRETIDKTTGKITYHIGAKPQDIEEHATIRYVGTDNYKANENEGTKPGKTVKLSEGLKFSSEGLVITTGDNGELSFELKESTVDKQDLADTLRTELESFAEQDASNIGINYADAALQNAVENALAEAEKKAVEAAIEKLKEGGKTPNAKEKAAAEKVAREAFNAKTPEAENARQAIIEKVETEYRDPNKKAELIAAGEKNGKDWREAIGVSKLAYRVNDDVEERAEAGSEDKAENKTKTFTVDFEKGFTFKAKSDVTTAPVVGTTREAADAGATPAAGAGTQPTTTTATTTTPVRVDNFVVEKSKDGVITYKLRETDYINTVDNTGSIEKTITPVDPAHANAGMANKTTWTYKADAPNKVATEKAVVQYVEDRLSVITDNIGGTLNIVADKSDTTKAATETKVDLLNDKLNIVGNNGIKVIATPNANKISKLTVSLTKESVGTEEIKDGSILYQDLSENAVQSINIANGAVGKDDIGSGAVGLDHLDPALSDMMTSGAKASANINLSNITPYGEAAIKENGPVVYTDEDGNRLLRGGEPAKEGEAPKYYKASDIKGKVYVEGVEGYVDEKLAEIKENGQYTVVIDKSKIVLSDEEQKAVTEKAKITVASDLTNEDVTNKNAQEMLAEFNIPETDSNAKRRENLLKELEKIRVTDEEVEAALTEEQKQLEQEEKAKVFEAKKEELIENAKNALATLRTSEAFADANKLKKDYLAETRKKLITEKENELKQQGQVAKPDAVDTNANPVRLSLVDFTTQDENTLTKGIVLDKVADGKISSDSLEAINGSQLYDTIGAGAYKNGGNQPEFVVKGGKEELKPKEIQELKDAVSAAENAVNEKQTALDALKGQPEENQTQAKQDLEAEKEKLAKAKKNLKDAGIVDNVYDALKALDDAITEGKTVPIHYGAGENFAEAKADSEEVSNRTTSGEGFRFTSRDLIIDAKAGGEINFKITKEGNKTVEDIALEKGPIVYTLSDGTRIAKGTVEKDGKLVDGHYKASEIAGKVFVKEGNFAGYVDENLAEEKEDGTYRFKIVVDDPTPEEIENALSEDDKKLSKVELIKKKEEVKQKLKEAKRTEDLVTAKINEVQAGAPRALGETELQGAVHSLVNPTVTDNAGTNNDESTTTPSIIRNVAKGFEDNDAVNVSQLKAVTNSLGGGSAVGADGTVTGPSYTITAGGTQTPQVYSNVGAALEALDKAITKGQTVELHYGAGENIRKARTAENSQKTTLADGLRFTSRDITITAKPTGEVNFSLSKDGSKTVEDIAKEKGTVVYTLSDGTRITKGDDNLFYKSADLKDKRYVAELGYVDKNLVEETEDGTYAIKLTNEQKEDIRTRIQKEDPTTIQIDENSIVVPEDSIAVPINTPKEKEAEVKAKLLQEAKEKLIAAKKAEIAEENYEKALSEALKVAREANRDALKEKEGQADDATVNAISEDEKKGILLSVVNPLEEDSTENDGNGKQTTTTARKLTNVADGKLSEDSKEAVNGSQLYATNKRVKALEDVVGKPNVDNPQNPDSPADDDGLKPTDTLAKKVDALRRGEAGPVVYTIEVEKTPKQGDTPATYEDVRVVKAGDGQYYELKAVEGKVLVEREVEGQTGQKEKVWVNYDANKDNIEDTDKDGIYTIKEVAADQPKLTVTELDEANKPKKIENAASKIRHSLVNEDGDVNTVSTLRNVAKGTLSETSTEAVNGTQLYALGTSTATAIGGGSKFDPTTGEVSQPSIVINRGLEPITEAKLKELEDAVKNAAENSPEKEAAQKALEDAKKDLDGRTKTNLVDAIKELDSALTTGKHIPLSYGAGEDIESATADSKTKTTTLENGLKFVSSALDIKAYENGNIVFKIDKNDKSVEEVVLEKGTVVYTDENGVRISKGRDGKYYKTADLEKTVYLNDKKVYVTKDKVDENPQTGEITLKTEYKDKDGDTLRTEKIAVAALENQNPTLIHSLVNPTVSDLKNTDKDESTTTESVLRNVADGAITETSTDAINGSQLYDLTRKADGIGNSLKDPIAEAAIKDAEDKIREAAKEEAENKIKEEIAAENMKKPEGERLSPEDLAKEQEEALKTPENLSKVAKAQDKAVEAALQDIDAEKEKAVADKAKADKEAEIIAKVLADNEAKPEDQKLDGEALENAKKQAIKDAENDILEAQNTALENMRAKEKAGDESAKAWRDALDVYAKNEVYNKNEIDNITAASKETVVSKHRDKDNPNGKYLTVEVAPDVNSDGGKEFIVGLTDEVITKLDNLDLDAKNKYANKDASNVGMNSADPFKEVRELKIQAMADKADEIEKTARDGVIAEVENKAIKALEEKTKKAAEIAKENAIKAEVAENTLKDNPKATAKDIKDAQDAALATRANEITEAGETAVRDLTEDAKNKAKENAVAENTAKIINAEEKAKEAKVNEIAEAGDAVEEDVIKQLQDIAAAKKEAEVVAENEAKPENQRLSAEELEKAKEEARKAGAAEALDQYEKALANAKAWRDSLDVFSKDETLEAIEVVKHKKSSDALYIKTTKGDDKVTYEVGIDEAKLRDITLDTVKVKAKANNQGLVVVENETKEENGKKTTEYVLDLNIEKVSELVANTTREKGIIAYTNEDGEKLTVGKDGKIYKTSELEGKEYDPDKNAYYDVSLMDRQVNGTYTLKKDVVNPEPVKQYAGKDIKHSLVAHDQLDAPILNNAMVLDNIADGKVAADSDQAINGSQLFDTIGAGAYKNGGNQPEFIVRGGKEATPKEKIAELKDKLEEAKAAVKAKQDALDALKDQPEEDQNKITAKEALEAEKIKLADAQAELKKAGVVDNVYDALQALDDAITEGKTVPIHYGAGKTAKMAEIDSAKHTTTSGEGFRFISNSLNIEAEANGKIKFELNKEDKTVEEIVKEKGTIVYTKADGTRVALGRDGEVYTVDSLKDKVYLEIPNPVEGEPALFKGYVNKNDTKEDENTGKLVFADGKNADNVTKVEPISKDDKKELVLSVVNPLTDATRPTTGDDNQEVDQSAKLTNVADGLIAKDSKEAVNGSQLYAAGTSTAAAIGGGATFDPTTGTISKPSIVINRGLEPITEAKLKELEDAVKNATENSPEKEAAQKALDEAKKDLAGRTKDNLVDAIKELDNALTTGKHIPLSYGAGEDIEKATADAKGKTTTLENGLKFVSSALDIKAYEDGNIVFKIDKNDKSVEEVVLEKGTVVYTKEDGTRISKGRDGKYYETAKLEDTVFVKNETYPNGAYISKDDVVEDPKTGKISLAPNKEITPIAALEDQNPTLVHSLVNPTVVDSADTADKDESTTTASKLRNVAKGDISENSTDAINGSQLYATNNRVSDLEKKIGKGENPEDKRNGNTDPEGNPVPKDGTNGLDGAAGKDGLNGKDLTEKVNALRRGEAGALVYTDEDGNRVVRGLDGKYYKADDIADKVFVDGKGYVEPTSEQKEKLEDPDGDGIFTAKKDQNIDDLVSDVNPLTKEQADKIKHSLVNRDGTTDKPSTLANVGSGIGLGNYGAGTEATKPVKYDGATAEGVKKAQTDAAKLYELDGAKLNNAVTAGDLQAVAVAGLDFSGNDYAEDDDNTVVHRNLGTRVEIVGEKSEKPTKDWTKTAVDNIYVDADRTNNKLEIKLAKELTNLTSVEAVDDDGNKAKLDGTGLTITPKQEDNATAENPNPKPISITKDGINAGDKPITNVGDGVNPADAVNKKQLDEVKALIGDPKKDGTDGTNGKDGTSAKDGLNGRDLTDKVNRLRNGEAGPVVYTMSDGTRIARTEDGNYYKLSDVYTVEEIEELKKQDPKTTAKAGDAKPNTKPLTDDEKSKIKHSLVNKDGDTTTPSVLSNVAAGEISKDSKDAVNGSQLYEIVENAKGVGNNQKDEKVIEAEKAAVDKLQNENPAATAKELADAKREAAIKVIEAKVETENKDKSPEEIKALKEAEIAKLDVANESAQNWRDAIDTYSKGEVYNKNQVYNKTEIDNITAASKETVETEDPSYIRIDNSTKNDDGGTKFIIGLSEDVKNKLDHLKTDTDYADNKLSNLDPEGENKVKNLATEAVEVKAVENSGITVKSTPTKVDENTTKVVHEIGLDKKALGTKYAADNNVDKPETQELGTSLVIKSKETDAKKDENNFSGKNIITKYTQDKSGNGTVEIAISDKPEFENVKAKKSIEIGEEIETTNEDGETIKKAPVTISSEVDKETGKPTSSIEFAKDEETGSGTGTITGIKTVDDPTSVVSKGYVDDKLNSDKRIELTDAEGNKVRKVGEKDGVPIYVAEKYIDENGEVAPNAKPLTPDMLSNSMVSPTGSTTTPTRLSNIADGILANDAVNKAQLDRVDKKANKALSGVAHAVAMASLPQINDAGANKHNLAASVGHYEGRTAVALGVSGVSDSGRILYKVNASADNNKQFAVGAGLGYQIGQRNVTGTELERLQAQLSLLQYEKKSETEYLRERLAEYDYRMRQLMEEVERLKNR